MLYWLSTIAGSMGSPFTLSSPQSLTSERLAAGSTKWGTCSSSVSHEFVDAMTMSLYSGSVLVEDSATSCISSPLLGMSSKL